MARLIFLCYCIFLSGQMLQYTIISLSVPSSMIYRLGIGSDITGQVVIAMVIATCLLATAEAISNALWPRWNNRLRRSHTAIWLLLSVCLAGESVVSWFVKLPFLVTTVFLWNSLGAVSVVCIGIEMQRRAIRASRATRADASAECAAVLRAGRRIGDA